MVNHVAAIILTLAALHPLTTLIEQERLAQRYVQPSVFESLGPGELTGTLALAGFRAAAIDTLWIKAMDLQKRQDWLELYAILQLLAKLQPHNPEIWQHNCWNMAFNISTGQTTLEESWKWIEAALDSLEQGIQMNPNSALLERYMAFILIQRVSDEPLYEEKLKAAARWGGRPSAELAIAALQRAVAKDLLALERGVFHMTGYSYYALCIACYTHAQNLLLQVEHTENGPVRVNLQTQASHYTDEAHRAYQQLLDYDIRYKDGANLDEFKQTLGNSLQMITEQLDRLK